MNAKKVMGLGFFLLALAVMLGAFGAHGLKGSLLPKYIETYKTGVTYHFYHAFGILFLGLLMNNLPKLNFNRSFYCFLIGIILFSGNCYLYALTQTKTFAMIVPLGGVLFIIGWIVGGITLIKGHK